MTFFYAISAFQDDALFHVIVFFVRYLVERDGLGRDVTGRGGPGRGGAERDGKGRDGTRRDGRSRGKLGMRDIPTYVFQA